MRIHEGTYATGSNNSNVDGTEANPIWIGKMTNEAKPLFSGLTADLGFQASSFLILHDLKITATASHNINIDDGQASYEVDGHDPDYNYDNSRFVVIRNIEFSYSGTGATSTIDNCLKVSGVNDFLVIDSTFNRCGMAVPSATSGDGIDFVGCHAGVVARNRFTTRKAVQIKGGSEDIEVRENYSKYIHEGTRYGAYNLGQDTLGMFFRPPVSTGNFEAKNIRLIANVIDADPSTGGAESAMSFRSCVDCLAANNTIVNPYDWVARIVHGLATDSGNPFPREESRDGRFINNIVYWKNSEGQSVEFQVAETSLEAEAATFSLLNNIWFDSDAYASPDIGAGLPIQTNGNNGSIVIDAQSSAVFAETTNYTIGASSPAANSGIRLPEVARDARVIFSATPICYRNPPSRGAYELP